MKRDVFTLPENATVFDAVKLLVDHHISAAPIVDGDGKPIAFVSDGDVASLPLEAPQHLYRPRGAHYAH